MSNTRVITRFAPSPNGWLHIGHAFSALFAADVARRHGGRFLLRIEDIDFTRARQEYVQGIFDDLAWLGLHWPKPVRHQRPHVALYCRALRRLREMGVLYPCHCTRRALRAATAAPDWPRDPDGAPVYSGTCRHLATNDDHPANNDRPADADCTAGADCTANGDEAPCARLGEWPLQEPLPPAWRLDMDKALALARHKLNGQPLQWREEGKGPNGEHGLLRADTGGLDVRNWGDVILGRRDIGVSYHVAVVIDDAVQGITHVTRGQDLFQATAIHRLLQVLLDLPEPAYVHHRLITDEQGRKLSKSAGDTTLRALREAGMTAKELRTRLGFGAETG